MYVVIHNEREQFMELTLQSVLCLVRKKSQAMMLADRLPNGRILTLREAKTRCDDLNYKGVIQHLLIN